MNDEASRESCEKFKKKKKQNSNEFWQKTEIMSNIMVSLLPIKFILNSKNLILAFGDAKNIKFQSEKKKLRFDLHVASMTS